MMLDIDMKKNNINDQWGVAWTQDSLLSARYHAMILGEHWKGKGGHEYYHKWTTACLDSLLLRMRRMTCLRSWNTLTGLSKNILDRDITANLQKHSTKEIVINYLKVQVLQHVTLDRRVCTTKALTQISKSLPSYVLYVRWVQSLYYGICIIRNFCSHNFCIWELVHILMSITSLLS